MCPHRLKFLTSNVDSRLILWRFLSGISHRPHSNSPDWIWWLIWLVSDVDKRQNAMKVSGDQRCSHVSIKMLSEIFTYRTVLFPWQGCFFSSCEVNFGFIRCWYIHSLRGVSFVWVFTLFWLAIFCVSSLYIYLLKKKELCNPWL